MRRRPTPQHPVAPPPPPPCCSAVAARRLGALLCHLCRLPPMLGRPLLIVLVVVLIMTNRLVGPVAQPANRMA
jgi:hypothetical protein